MTRSRGFYTGSLQAGRIISGIGAVLALIEAVYIVMVLFGANQANAFFGFIRSLALPLALFFPGLFPIANPQLAVLVNYGLAAVFWLVVTSILAHFFAR